MVLSTYHSSQPASCIKLRTCHAEPPGDNLGIALNFDRAERTVLGSLGAKAAANPGAPHLLPGEFEALTRRVADDGHRGGLEKVLAADLDPNQVRAVGDRLKVAEANTVLKTLSSPDLRVVLHDTGHERSYYDTVLSL